MTFLPGLDVSLSWGSTLDARQVARLQAAGAGQVLREDRFHHLQRIAGLDVGYRRKGQSCGAAVLLDLASLKPLECSWVELPIEFPYLPGALAFREVPVLIEALKRLTQKPDLLICDGHGIAHPRRFGLASHLGLLLDCASIGCAKRRLVGEHEPVPNVRGAWSLLTDQGEVIGAVLRTRRDVSPVFVSIGHKVSLETAVEITLRCAPRFRLPEPLRHAHQLASRGEWN